MCKQMTSGSFRNITNKLFTYKSHPPTHTHTHTHTHARIYIYVYIYITGFGIKQPTRVGMAYNTIEAQPDGVSFSVIITT